MLWIVKLLSPEYRKHREQVLRYRRMRPSRRRLVRYMNSAVGKMFLRTLQENTPLWAFGETTPFPPAGKPIRFFTYETKPAVGDVI